MKKISLIALAGALCIFGAHADEVDMRETVVAVDTVNGDVPAPTMDGMANTPDGTTTVTTVVAAPIMSANGTPDGVAVAGVSETIVSVRDARSMPNNARLVLRGNIIKSLGDEKYTFQDDTDTITVEIDDDSWNGQVVSPTDTVILYGEVDSGLFKTEIDVDRIQIVQ